MNRAIERNKSKIETLKKQKLIEEKHKKRLSTKDKEGMLKTLNEAKKILGLN